MECDIDFDAGGLFDVVVTTSGAFDPIEFSRCRDRVYGDPRFRPGMNVLVDHSQIDLLEVDIADVRITAEGAARRYPESGLGRMAIVVPGAVGYGLGRMWQSLTSDELADRTCHRRIGG